MDSCLHVRHFVILYICIQFQIAIYIAILYNYDFMQCTMGMHVALYESWCGAVYSYS